MSNQTTVALQDAFDLIEENQLAEAREILKPLLESEPNNPTVWWVYAHAVEDGDEGIRALDKVLELDPTYPDATELKSQISNTKIDNYDDLDFEEDSTKQKVESRQNPLRNILLIIVVVIIALFAGLFVLSQGGGGNDTPTEVANQPTTLPTADIQIITNTSATIESAEPTITVSSANNTETPIPTSESTELPDSASYVDELLENLSNYNVTTDDISTSTTTLGETVIVRICAILGAESSIRLNDTMSTFVQIQTSLPESAEGVAVTLIDCNEPESIARIIGVEKSILQSFANEEIELKDFQRQWQPLQLR